MNVAYINAVCGTGSTGSICEDLATGLIDKGHHCTIYYGNGDSENPIAKDDFKLGGKISCNVL